MRLKPALQIIEFSNLALIIGLIMCVISIATNSRDGKFFILELLIAIPFLLAFFFRLILINFYLKICKYPVVFLAVLDKLNLSNNLDIKLSEQAEKDFYKPTYPTDSFLLDNNLITKIGPKKSESFYIWITITIILIGLSQLASKTKFLQYPFPFISLLITLIICLYFLAKKKKQIDDINPLVQFTEKGICIKDDWIDWKNVFDWNYVPGCKGFSDQIIISYYDPDKNMLAKEIDLGFINSNKIDFILLLTHFKAKYS